jgi:hypothetical protein
MNIELVKAGIDDFDFSKFTFLSGGAGITSSSYQKTMAQFAAESRRQSFPKEFLAQQSAEESLNIYMKSLREGEGGSQLDVITEESRLRRRLIPLTSYQLYRNTKMYQEAGAPRVIEALNFVFVFYPQNHPVLPIILRKEGRVWRVHEPLSWALFQRFEDSMRVFLKYPLEGGTVALRSFINTTFGEPLYFRPRVDLAKLSQGLTPNSSVEEVYFNLNWPEFVVENLSETKSEDQLWILADSYQNLGRFTEFRDVYKKLFQLYPGNRRIQMNHQFYEEQLVFKDVDWRLEF